MGPRLLWRMKLCCLVLFALTTFAQTEAPKKPLGRVIGEVTAKDPSGSHLTVKADNGSTYTVNIQEKTSYVRVAPGEKDLKKAERIDLAGVHVGDRVMARGDVSEEQKSVPAVALIVMSKADLTQKHQREQADWQKRGASGVVKSVTPDSKELMIATRTRQGVTTLTKVVTTSDTDFRRYAPDSVRFADATPSSLSDIKEGDQVRVLGTKSEDSTKIDAEAVVSGSFRTIAGTVISVDPAAGEIKLNDIDTKKPATIKVNADSQIRKLPQMAAMMLARRLNPTFAAAMPAGMNGGQGRPGGPGASAENARPAGLRPNAGPEGGAAAPGGPPRGGAAGGGDIGQMLERIPTQPLSEIQTGEPVIVFTSAANGSAAATAITVLSGVDPILRAAPSGGGPVNLGTWSLELNMPGQQ